MKQVVAPSSSREPGTLQYGVLHSQGTFFDVPISSAPVAVRSDGSVVGATCSGVVAFDATLHETGRVDLDSRSNAFAVNVAVAPDDAVYALVPEGMIRIDDLDHVSTAREARWITPVGATLGVLVAGTEGPYTEPDSDFGVPPQNFTIHGFDALTGQPRTVASGQYLLAAARGGGVFTVEQQGKQSATLRRLDPDGTAVWSRTLTSTFDGLVIQGAAAAADGGVIVFGDSPTPVDFGDRTLASPGQFVAGFDVSGMTRWGFTSASFITHIAQTAQGEILIAGDTALGGGEGAFSTDASLSVATQAGISRTLYIRGPGDQRITGLAATPDGFAWIAVTNFRHDDPEPEPVIQIGAHTFPDSGGYLFKIVP
ncbi:MAG TPA: hypothetical protein VF516_01485 [Kofleriaceae bacterium]